MREVWNDPSTEPPERGSIWVGIMLVIGILSMVLFFSGHRAHAEECAPSSRIEVLQGVLSGQLALLKKMGGEASIETATGEGAKAILNALQKDPEVEGLDEEHIAKVDTVVAAVGEGGAMFFFVENGCVVGRVYYPSPTGSKAQQ